ncbi:MAG: polysaccharide deacetylase family protein [Clostridia bacterium]|nr:polysaccharide deacetylase family protein [Clostridia bacterium]
MINGKKKAITFSYDDGVTQDIRLIELLNKYGLKCTFNLNSDLLGLPGELVRDNVRVSHDKINPDDVKSVYDGHEVAAHTLMHPFLPEIKYDNVIVRQVEQDRINLSELVGYEVVGMAYPGGGVNFNEHVAEVIKNNTGIKYARTTVPTFNFDLQEDLYVFKPTIHHHDHWEQLFELGQKFVELDPKEDQIFYIWGHAYEFDIDPAFWDKMEEFFKIISGKSDIFYGTNAEVLL